MRNDRARRAVARVVDPQVDGLPPLDARRRQAKKSGLALLLALWAVLGCGEPATQPGPPAPAKPAVMATRAERIEAAMRRGGAYLAAHQEDSGAFGRSKYAAFRDGYAITGLGLAALWTANERAAYERGLAFIGDDGAGRARAQRRELPLLRDPACDPRAEPRRQPRARCGPRGADRPASQAGSSPPPGVLPKTRPRTEDGPTIPIRPPSTPSRTSRRRCCRSGRCGFRACRSTTRR